MTTDLLLVDDNSNLRVGLAANLRNAGFSVVVAADGAEGVKLANEILPGLIVCDLKIPASDGLEIERILNTGQGTSGIPSIFLNGLLAPLTTSAGIKLGVEKPIEDADEGIELISRLQALLKRKDRIELLTRPDGIQLIENLRACLPLKTGHIFRTYLGVLLLSLQMIAKNQGSTDQYLNYARKSAFRLKIWLETLIWINDLELGRCPVSGEEVDIDYSFTGPIKELLEIWRDKQLKVEFQVNAGISIFTPAHNFTQVVCHLVDNACKFSPKGGSILIRLQSNGLDGSVFTIQDQGTGIPENRRESVFERHPQQPGQPGLPENRGMGLGLFMVRSFARNQSGEARILSTGTGCKLEMTLKNKPYRFNSSSMRRI